MEQDPDEADVGLMNLAVQAASAAVGKGKFDAIACSCRYDMPKGLGVVASGTIVRLKVGPATGDTGATTCGLLDDSLAHAEGQVRIALDKLRRDDPKNKAAIHVKIAVSTAPCAACAHAFINMERTHNIIIDKLIYGCATGVHLDGVKLLQEHLNTRLVHMPNSGVGLLKVISPAACSTWRSLGPPASPRFAAADLAAQLQLALHLPLDVKSSMKALVQADIAFPSVFVIDKIVLVPVLPHSLQLNSLACSTRWLLARAGGARSHINGASARHQAVTHVVARGSAAGGRRAAGVAQARRGHGRPVREPGVRKVQQRERHRDPCRRGALRQEGADEDKQGVHVREQV